MKKINLKVIAIILVIGSLLVFGISTFEGKYTLKKYRLATMAKLQGAKYLSIEDDSVTFLLDNSYITYYKAGYSYGIRSLSGK